MRSTVAGSVLLVAYSCAAARDLHPLPTRANQLDCEVSSVTEPSTEAQRREAYLIVSLCLCVSVLDFVFGRDAYPIERRLHLGVAGIDI